MGAATRIIVRLLLNSLAGSGVVAGAASSGLLVSATGAALATGCSSAYAGMIAASR
jgi:hypothetical protein